MIEKTEKDIILLEDANSYSFCYFYSGTFDKKDIEAKLSELYKKKLGEDAKFSYKITQKNEANTWFASVGCKAKAMVPAKINLPRAYFSALVISRKYKEEYIYVVVEESSSLVIFLCHNEPLCSARINNKLLAISSEIGKDIDQMTEIFNKEKAVPVKVEKLVFYGSLSQEQINLIIAPAIKEKIKEASIDYALYDAEVDLTLTKEKAEEKIKPEGIKEVVSEPPDRWLTAVPEIEKENVPPAEKEAFVQREIPLKAERNKAISTILAALIFGACAFPGAKLFIKGMNFYRDKINANVEILKTSSITAPSVTLGEEITARTTLLTAASGLLNYSSDIFKNIIDTALFGDPKVRISGFKIEAGIYILEVTVASEKDLENYLAKIIFSNKLVLAGAPTEISAGKSYELRIIPFPVA